MNITLVEKRSSFSSNGIPFQIEISEETFNKIKVGTNCGFNGRYEFNFLEWNDFSESEKEELDSIIDDDTVLFVVVI